MSEKPRRRASRARGGLTHTAGAIATASMLAMFVAPVIILLGVHQEALHLVKRAGVEPARRRGIKRGVAVEAEPRERLKAIALTERALAEDPALASLTMTAKKPIILRHF